MAQEIYPCLPKSKDGVAQGENTGYVLGIINIKSSDITRAENANMNAAYAPAGSDEILSETTFWQAAAGCPYHPYLFTTARSFRKPDRISDLYLYS